MQQSRRYEVWALFFMLALTSGTALGQHPRRHSFEVGPELYYFYYEEHEPFVFFGEELGDEVTMQEDGLFYGVSGAYTFRGWLPSSDAELAAGARGLTLRGEGRFAVGTVDYDGKTWGGEPLTISDIDDRTMEFRPLIGFGSADADSESLLYTGFGYRYLNDDLSDAPGGYERESNYYYIPIGITGTNLKSSGWSIGGTFEFDILLRGVQKTHLSDTGAGWPDIENKQKSGWGLRGSLRFERRADVDLVLEPFVRLWAVARSDDAPIGDGYYVYEPENYTLEGGLSVTIRF